MKPSPPDRDKPKQAQQQRLAEALRANLRRRKEQARRRAEDDAGAPPGDGKPSTAEGK